MNNKRIETAHAVASTPPKKILPKMKPSTYYLRTTLDSGLHEDIPLTNSRKYGKKAH